MKLKRNGTHLYQAWRNTGTKEPLVVFGPRQVGKSFSIKDFGQQNFARVHEINFWKEPFFRECFLNSGSVDLNPVSIIRRLELRLDTRIDVNNDLLLFDEIQDCPPAYQSLKFFKEDLPNMHIIATGSYLQLLLEREQEFERQPVGNTREIYLRPLTFDEFLQNSAPMLHENYLQIPLFETQPIDRILHEKLLEQYRLYMFTGGMPEVVSLFLQENPVSSLTAAKNSRKKQLDLLAQYQNDLLKYARHTNLSKIRDLFVNIPFQLNQYQDESVQRFGFGAVAGRQGYRVLRAPFDYLELAGLIIRTYIVSSPNLPMRTDNEKEASSRFKCFWFDIGLLNASLGASPTAILESNLGAYKGFIAENFAAMELYCRLNRQMASFKASSHQQAAEVEFLVEKDGQTIPIEIKSSHKSTGSKSFTSYVEKYRPAFGFKLTPGNVGRSSGLPVLPIYLAGRIADWLLE